MKIPLDKQNEFLCLIKEYYRCGYTLEHYEHKIESMVELGSIDEAVRLKMEALSEFDRGNKLRTSLTEYIWEMIPEYQGISYDGFEIDLINFEISEQESHRQHQEMMQRMEKLKTKISSSLGGMGNEI